MDRPSSSCDAVVSSSVTGSSSEVNGNNGESAEGGEEDDSSSSSIVQLDNFREQWHRELKSTFCVIQSNTTIHSNRNQNPEHQKNSEEKAIEMYFQGVKAERHGHLSDAIRYYRRAFQLVPDIECKVAGVASKDILSGVVNSSSDDDDDSDDDDEDDDADVFAGGAVDLTARFTRFINKDGKICQPCYDQQAAHVSILPSEVLMYIFKWVVSSDLDLISLERLSFVCRGFYLCARDAELWRLVCTRIWGVDCGSPNKYGSWRSMYITRPHLLFNGAYISKTTYVRPGEPTFQDYSYKPWHVVDYYRYLRFFPEGLVLMITTPEEPVNCLSLLRQRGGKNPMVLSGRYHVNGNVVTAVLKRTKVVELVQHNRYRRTRQIVYHDPGEQTFHLELELVEYKMKLNCKLIWRRYSSHTVYRSGLESVADFEISQSKFPPLWYSRVKSYTAFSEKPLN